MISYSLSKIKENKINPSYNSLISIDINIYNGFRSKGNDMSLKMSLKMPAKKQ